MNAWWLLKQSITANPRFQATSAQTRRRR
jgi:hypothetical protein